jgi:hypothetical protein
MPVIAFIGADGAGKTTLIDALVTKLELPARRLYLGQNLYAVPFLGRWGTTEGRLRFAIFRWIFYPLDLRIRTLRLTAEKWFHRKNQAVLIDRLPAFPFASGSGVLQSIYKFALPKIDILVLLTGDADLIYSRKPESSKQEFLKNFNKVESLFNNFKAQHQIRLDVTRTVDQHVADMIGHINAAIASPVESE